MESLLRVAEVAQVLNVSLRKVWELTASGVLPSVRIGRSVRFRPEDVRAFLERNLKRAL